MAEGDFDDIEMKNKNREEEEEEFKEAETDFGGEEDTENLDEGSPKMKFNRVETLTNLKKVAGKMKRQITTISKQDFKTFFKIDIYKKDGENSKILIEETEFVNNPKNDYINVFFRGKQVGKIIQNGTKNMLMNLKIVLKMLWKCIKKLLIALLMKNWIGIIMNGILLKEIFSKNRL